MINQFSLKLYSYVNINRYNSDKGAQTAHEQIEMRHTKIVIFNLTSCEAGPRHMNIIQAEDACLRGIFSTKHIALLRRT